MNAKTNNNLKKAALTALITALQEWDFTEDQAFEIGMSEAEGQYPDVDGEDLFNEFGAELQAAIRMLNEKLEDLGE